MSNTVAEKTEYELYSKSRLLKVFKNSQMDLPKAISMALSFRDEIHALMAKHGINFDKSEYELHSPIENDFITLAKEVDGEAITISKRLLTNKTQLSEEFIDAVANVSLSLIHIETVIELSRLNPRKKMNKLNSGSLYLVAENASTILYRPRDYAANSTELPMLLSSEASQLLCNLGNNTAINNLIKDFSILLNRMALAYYAMDGSTFTEELLRTQKDIYRDTSENDNEVIGKVALPKYCIYKAAPIPHNEEGDYHLHALVRVEGGKAEEYGRALAYTMGRSCDCDHDGCMHIQISASTQIVSPNWVHLRLRYYRNN